MHMQQTAQSPFENRLNVIACGLKISPDILFIALLPYIPELGMSRGWGYYPGTMSCSHLFATHFEIGHP